MKFRHSHPINILEHTSKFLVLLVFPIIRALLFTNVGFYAWLKGAWFDLLIIFMIVALGFFAWFKYLYSTTDEGIYIRKGVIIVKNRFIPYKNLSVLSIEKPFFLMPFGAVRVNADTDGGLPTIPDFKITIKKKELDELIEKATTPFINQGEIKRVYLPKNFYIAILSFIVSNTLTGVIFTSTFVSGIGRVLGKEIENQMKGQLTAIVEKLAFGIPPVAATIGFVLLGGWGVSFILNVIRHLRFSVTRQSKNLHIKMGIITQREHFLTVNRINLVELRQTFLTKIFGFYSAFVHCNGYGKKKDELSILMPAGERHDLQQNIKILLPEIPICKPTIKPKKKYLSRFLIPPINCILGVLVLWIGLAIVFPQFHDIIFFIGIMAEILCVWYLFVKVLSYFHTGIGYSDDVYTFCYTYGYKIKTVAVPKQRIVHLTIRQSMFQLMSGSCDLVVLTFSEGKKRHVIPSIKLEEAKKIMDAFC